LDKPSIKLSSLIHWSGEYGAKLAGEEYYDGEKYQLSLSSEDYVFAKANGSKTYTTTLEWCESLYSENELELELVSSCSCPAYEHTRDACKHIWGLIRTVEAPKNKQQKFVGNFNHKIQDEICLSTHFEYYAELNKFVHTREYQSEMQTNLADLNYQGEHGAGASEQWQNNLRSLERYISEANEEADSPSNNSVRQALHKGKMFYELETFMGIELDSGYDYLNICLHEALMKKNGEFGRYNRKNFHQNLLGTYKNTDDEKYLNLLKGHLVYGYSKSSSEAAIPASLSKLLLKEIVKSNRLFVYSARDNSASDIIPLQMKDKHYTFSANITKDEKFWILGGVFTHNGHEVDAQTASLTTDMSYVILDHTLYPVDLGKLRAHCEYVLSYGNIMIPLDRKEDLRDVIKNTIGLEQTLLDKEFGIEKKVLKGLAKIDITLDERKEVSVLGQLQFLYDSELHHPKSKKDIYNESTVNDLFYVKDQNHEKKILRFLEESNDVFGIEHLEHFIFNVEMNNLNDFVKAASENGIEVRTMGVKLKHHHSSQNQIKSNADWFELEGSIQFDKDEEISIPAILKQKTIDNHFIQLGDGNLGISPNAWLGKMKKLSQLGVKEENKIKFNRAQAIILDIMLEETAVESDQNFRDTVTKLRSFKGVDKVNVSKRFQGELRDYQKSGLDWLNFLYQFKLGGCLADDMGLGKTIQVLAHLQRIKYSKNAKFDKGQHLVVVPKSLVYNWKNEAKKFTPDLKVLIYEGTKREALIADFSNYDIVLMTYAVMRKDIQILKEHQFIYSVLDEAQNIKNTTTLVAKASYLINSRYRLVLTGTPVENHIGELFSIFRFLIPSLLPKGYSLGKIKTNEDSLKLILRGLMPFILRRTKSEVLSELPEKVESILYCDFEKKQERIYNEIKLFYQKSLNQTVKKDGLNKSKIQVLEALLRMRQASCHPGLINSDHQHFPSSKLITLMENIESLIARGEKVLVFSQFTSFLSIIKNTLDTQGIDYAYLDGKTRNREVVVNSFKEDQKKSVFLISLKAGGVGLNLTEANYCFLVDPWWNPAVEAQAIDRIHRIGQKKKVFAYRLITKGSIEEKILKLQDSKRAITKNIMATDDSLLKQMSKEDLQFLFS